MKNLAYVSNVDRRQKVRENGLTRLAAPTGHFPWVGLGSLALFAAICVGTLISIVASSLDISLTIIFTAGLVSASLALMAIWNRLRPRSARGMGTAVNTRWPDVPLDKVLLGLVRAAELRDTELGGHCKRVAENSVLVGREMGLGHDSLRELYWGGILHDLGKIAVADQTLKKASRLSEEELAEIRRHPTYGADLLTTLAAELNGIASIVRYHHERWDGYGYPAGLKGDAIPLSARIVAVADVFEALTSSRPYRQPLRSDQALVYLRRSVGTHFAPDVVSTFENLFNAGRLQVSEDAPARTTESHGQPNWTPGFSNAN